MPGSNGKSMMPARLLANSLISRASLIQQSTDDERDLNKLLKYPDRISLSDYREMFERSDVAERVVTIDPDACWSVQPQVYDDEDEKKTTRFEKDWDNLVQEVDLYHYLHRIDVLSGIGHYGVLLLGFDDGRELREPVAEGSKLIFLRAFPEELAPVEGFVDDPRDPRFGMPQSYKVSFGGSASETGQGTAINTLPLKSKSVHWTRVLHVAEGLQSNEVYGKPRMRPVFNRLKDLQRLAGGSAEMYWRGAFPGYLFNVDPEFAALAGLDDTEEGKSIKQEMATEMELMTEGLKRYIAALGVTPHSLTTQVVAPDKHIQTILRIISITLGIPFRIFMGSEQGSLASSQDIRTRNRRVAWRQRQHISPVMLRPLVHRLVDIKTVRPPRDRVKIFWPDLDTLSEQDRADVADKRMTTLQKYVTGNVEQILTVEDLFSRILGVDREEAAIMEKKAREDREFLTEQMQSSGGADNMVKGESPGGQNPKSPSSDRSRSGGGASGNG